MKLWKLWLEMKTKRGKHNSTLARGTEQGAKQLEHPSTSVVLPSSPSVKDGPSTMVSEAKNRQDTGKARAQGAGGNEEGEGSPGG